MTKIKIRQISTSYAGIRIGCHGSINCDKLITISFMLDLICWNNIFEIECDVLWIPYITFSEAVDHETFSYSSSYACTWQLFESHPLSVIFQFDALNDLAPHSIFNVAKLSLRNAYI